MDSIQYSVTEVLVLHYYDYSISNADVYTLGNNGSGYRHNSKKKSIRFFSLVKL